MSRKHVKTDTTRCGCCLRAVAITKDDVIARPCLCLARMSKTDPCYKCGRCPEHCCKTGWKRPVLPGQAAAPLNKTTWGRW